MENYTNESQTIQAPPQPVAEGAPAVQSEATAVKSPKRLSGLFAPDKIKKTCIILGVIVILLAALITTLCCCLSAKSVALQCAKSIIYFDAKKQAALSAYDYEAGLIDVYEDEEDFFNSSSNEYDEDIESWDDYCRVRKANGKAMLEDEYGVSKVSFDVTKIKDMSVRKMSSTVDFEYYESYEFDRDDVTACKLVTVKCKVSGEDINGRMILDIYLVKMGLLWKMITWEMVD